MSTLPFTLFGSPTPTPSPRLAPSQSLTPPAKTKRKKAATSKQSIKKPKNLPVRKKPQSKKRKRSPSPSLEPPEEEEVTEVQPTRDPLEGVRAAAKARVAHYTATSSKNFCSQYHPERNMRGRQVMVVQLSLLVGVLLNIGARYGVKVTDLICSVLACEEDWEEIVGETLGETGLEKMGVHDGVVASVLGRRMGIDHEMGGRVLCAEVEAELERRNSGTCVFYGLDGRKEVLEAPGMSPLERVLKDSMRYQDSLSLAMENARI